jgi:hypothetical protein
VQDSEVEKNGTCHGKYANRGTTTWAGKSGSLHDSIANAIDQVMPPKHTSNSLHSRAVPDASVFFYVFRSRTQLLFRSLREPQY